MRLLIDTTVAKNRAAYALTAKALVRRQKGVLITRISGTSKPEITVEWFSQADMPADIENTKAIHSCLKCEAPLLFTDKSAKVETDAEIFVEPIIPRPRLLIAGGGHIGQALARQAVLIGFEVTVIDDRAEFTNTALFGNGVTTLCGDISKQLADFSIEKDTYIVIVTRGHKKDAECFSVHPQQCRLHRYDRL